MIGVERVGDVITLELQRPERRNALNSALVDALRDAVQKAAADDIRAIVLTGAGTVFCAGADLSGDVFAADFPDKAIALNLELTEVFIKRTLAVTRFGQAPDPVFDGNMFFSAGLSFYLPPDLKRAD